MAALTTALVALLAVPLLATPAAAAPTATVTISQATTVPAVSVDQGGSVTFVNSIPARTDLLGVTLAMDVTVALPSGSHLISPGASFTETFQSSCLTCTVTYKYRVSSGLPLAGLPGLPVSLPMIVNTILPLPNLPVPPVSVPSVPLPNLPVPGLPAPPDAGSIPVPGATPAAPPAAGGPAPQTGGTTTTGVTVGEQIMPTGGGPLILGAPNGFQERRAGPSTTSNGAGGGSGTGIGGYDGAEAPIFGVLEGLDGTQSEANTGVLPTAAAENEPIPNVLGTPALLAVLLLSVVSAGLVRTTVLARRTKKLVPETSA